MVIVQVSKYALYEASYATSPLSPVHITDDIALLVGSAPLELRAGKDLINDIIQSSEPVCTYNQHLSLVSHSASRPPKGTFRRLVEDAEDLLRTHCLKYYLPRSLCT